MRILHSTFMTLVPPGVRNQLSWEQQAADQLGLPWRSALYSKDDSCHIDGLTVRAPENCLAENGIRGWVRLRQSYYSWLEREQRAFDLILLRYLPHDPFQVRFLGKFGHKIFLVHHTKELEELRSSGGRMGAAKAILDRLLGFMSLRLAKGIIGVTPEIANYEKRRLPRHYDVPALIYPNGIYIPNQSKVEEDERGEVPEFLFVASYFAPWHGLDLVLDQMEENSAPFVLHLVGDLSASDLERARMDNRIILHGRLAEGQIRELSRRCWLGLASFALDRMGMRQACPLKVREYLINGLPVYGGYEEVLPENFRFYQFGPLSLESILSYAQEVRGADRLTVKNAASPLVSKQILLGNLYRSLCQAVPVI